MVAHNGHSPVKKQPPAPRIRHLRGDAYEVLSRRTGETYTAQVQPDGTIECACPARTVCYHLSFVAAVHATRRENLIDELLREIKTICCSEFMERYEKDDAIWQLAKRIEGLRGTQERAARKEAA